MIDNGTVAQTAWSSLGLHNPLALAPARILAHHAVQWVSLAARANLPAAPDDSQTSLAWDRKFAALVCPALGQGGEKLQLGLRIATAELIAIATARLPEAFSLDRHSSAQALAWVDTQLRDSGLKPVAGLKPTYELPDPAFAPGAAFDAGAQAGSLAELARWFAAGDALLAGIASTLAWPSTLAGAVRCWPHHFDIATLLRLDSRQGEGARSIGIGLSPGDGYYPQPYLYVSPWPYPKQEGLPALPPPGHWHTRDFFGAIAPADALLSFQDRAAAARAFVADAFAACRGRLGA